MFPCPRTSRCRQIPHGRGALSPVRLIRLIRAGIGVGRVGGVLPFLHVIDGKEDGYRRAAPAVGTLLPPVAACRDSLRHAVTFLRRATDREHLREMAWGDGRGRDS
jgi:hypothetical protein